MSYRIEPLLHTSLLPTRIGDSPESGAGKLALVTNLFRNENPDAETDQVERSVVAPHVRSVVDIIRSCIDLKAGQILLQPIIPSPYAEIDSDTLRESAVRIGDRLGWLGYLVSDFSMEEYSQHLEDGGMRRHLERNRSRVVNVEASLAAIISVVSARCLHSVGIRDATTSPGTAYIFNENCEWQRIHEPLKI